MVSSLLFRNLPFRSFWESCHNFQLCCPVSQSLTKLNKLFRCPVITQWLFLYQLLMACLPLGLIEHMTFVSTKWPIFISLLSVLLLQLSKSYNFIFSRNVFISIKSYDFIISHIESILTTFNSKRFNNLPSNTMCLKNHKLIKVFYFSSFYFTQPERLQ